jgi:ferredoxin-like protein FixX
MSTVNVDVKLGVNKFRVDETNPHHSCGRP